MAYITQEKKKEINLTLRPLLKKWGIKGTLSIKDNMCLMLTIKDSNLDFAAECGNTYFDININAVNKYFEGSAREALKEILPVLNDGNYDASQLDLDYHDVGWYVAIKVANSNKAHSVAA